MQEATRCTGSAERESMNKEKVQTLLTLLKDYEQEIAEEEYTAAVKDPDRMKDMEALSAAALHIQNREYLKELSAQEVQEERRET